MYQEVFDTSVHNRLVEGYCLLFAYYHKRRVFLIERRRNFYFFIDFMD